MKKVIVINKETMDEYKKVYFLMNPNCRIYPKYFTNPIPPSWNVFLAKIRMSQNDMKGKYKDFAYWLAFKNGIANLKLSKATFTFKFYFGDKRGRDVDNFTLSAKMINDGFVSAKVLIDDTSKHLALNFPPHEYDKINPRLEIIIDY